MSTLRVFVEYHFLETFYMVHPVHIKGKDFIKRTRISLSVPFSEHNRGWRPSFRIFLALIVSQSTRFTAKLVYKCTF